MIYSIMKLPLAAKNSLTSSLERFHMVKHVWDCKTRKKNTYIKNLAYWDITGLEL
jgi:hypothetical protein